MVTYYNFIRVPYDWLPSDIGGCKLWLRSDLGPSSTPLSSPLSLNPLVWLRSDTVTKDGSDLITQWTDKSGNGYHFTPGTSPLWVDAQLNSYPAIRFNGVDQFLKNSSLSLTQPLDIYFVVKQIAWEHADALAGQWVASSTKNAINIRQVTNTPYLDLNSSNPYDAVWAPTATKLAIGVWGLVQARFNGVSSLLRCNGSSAETGDAGIDNATAWGIGAAYDQETGNGYVFINADIAEVIIVPPLSDVQRIQLQNYVFNRYNLPEVISTWGDQSGNNHDLIQDVLESRKPLRYLNQLNGYPSIRFDGSDDALLATYILNQPFTVFLVMKQITWTDEDFVFAGSGAFAGMYQNGTSPNLSLHAGVADPTTGALAVGNYGIVTCEFNGANSRILVNGGNAVTGNPSTLNPGGLMLGAFYGGQNSNIDVVEIVEYDSILSDTDHQCLGVYFNTKAQGNGYAIY